MQNEIKTIEHINQPLNYAEKVDDVLNTPLTVDNVDSYANNALYSLIDILDQASKEYNRQPTISLDGISPKDQEDIVANYFGIPNIGDLLDQTVLKSRQLDSINSFIQIVPTSGTSVLPPELIKFKKRSPADGSFEKAIVVPKLKTLLFILENEFGIDINDTEQLKVSLGSPPDRAMRKEAYYIVQLDKLSRIVLICDEQKNITFVFDSDRLAEAGVSIPDLAEISKLNLKDLIEANPSIGSTVSQTNKFASKLILALKDPSSKIDSEESLKNPNYLVMSPPEGYLSTNGIAIELKVSHSTVAKAIKELELKPDGRYQYDSTIAYGYCPEKIEKVRVHIRENGVFSEHAPEGYLSVNEIAEKFGVDYTTVKNAVIALELESDGKYKNVNRVAEVYGPEKIYQIHAYLEEKGIFSIEAPEGYLNIALIAQELKVSPAVVSDAINELRIEPDDKYKYGTKITGGYNPEKIARIRIHLIEKGIIAETAPEGYMSIGGMMIKFKRDSDSIKRAIRILKIEPDGRYKNKARVTDFYNPEKVEKIRLYLEGRRRKLGQKAVS